MVKGYIFKRKNSQYVYMLVPSLLTASYDKSNDKIEYIDTPQLGKSYVDEIKASKDFRIIKGGIELPSQNIQSMTATNIPVNLEQAIRDNLVRYGGDNQ